MRHSSFFRLSAMTVIWFYCCALAQAGQVITANDKSWASQAVKHEGKLETIKTTNSIAVLYFNNTTGQTKLDPLQKGLAVMLITDLAKVEQFQVVERVRLQALLDEMDLGISGLADPATAPRLGKLLGAYYVESGELLTGKMKELEIAPSLLDVPFETVTKQPAVEGNLEELFKLEKDILFNIIENTNVSISPAKKIELEKPLSVSTAALLALFAGIDYSDQGQYGEAAKMYEQALVEDPDLEMAKNALQELKGMGLTSSEEAGTVEEQAAATTEEGISAGTIVGIGAALAAIGGGVVLALGSSSSNDENSSSGGSAATPPDAGADTTPPTVIAKPSPNTELSCSGGTFTFTFSTPMNTQSGQVTTVPSGFVTTTVNGWDQDGLIYTVSWAHEYHYESPNNVCGFEGKLDVTLEGFQNTAGVQLGTTNFTYSVK